MFHKLTLSILVDFLIKKNHFPAQIRKIGDEPFRDILKQLGGWPVTETDWKPPTFSIEYLLGHLRGEFSESVLLEVYVGADDKNSSVNILQIDQLVLALPSRDYYLKPSSKGDLAAYHRYMTQIAIIMGANPETASSELEDVVNFEIKLANVRPFSYYVQKLLIFKHFLILLYTYRHHFPKPIVMTQVQFIKN